ncbi:MAG: hypothetical protein WAN66_01995 [Limnoraphis robusta]|jgi:hypothetical protein|uniref:Uncharacterized protein n=2 Tax=Limnoraphis robusta TaxID=1118279 RepID=A0A0F5YE21_9CYAN|nr:hypothetical protein [Limnoraphis robusta]MCG5059592.1 hypothetical protein [Limnoraphis sp. WC205]KKD37129.1 hypothetical protein WN50_16065 [Limnoraphis robusta CS-951]KMW70549.1 hypothetical protein WN50_34445 [Limnoraphis robusta CS-951]MEA5500520.1 hypothetical protein [Limnoraphis robusta BA-68 BA1]MEA5518624.1 hypothetical protein [Limnoraphis robusta CCNP1315]
MNKIDPLEYPDDQHVRLFVYLVPVIGVFPALWSLYRRQGTPQHLRTSRLAVTLALGWLLGHLALEAGSSAVEIWSLPLLLGSSVLTTSYFIVCFGLMIRLWQRQPLWLPGMSQLAERLLGKHLS